MYYCIEWWLHKNKKDNWRVLGSYPSDINNYEIEIQNGISEVKICSVEQFEHYIKHGMLVD